MTAEVWRRRTGLWVLTAIATLAGGGVIGTAAQPATPRILAGSWTLQTSTGDLPGQAVRAFDGSSVSTATIEIDPADAHVAVRRIAPDAALLRVMVLRAGEPDAGRLQGAVLTAQAEWRARTLVAHGEVTIKQGFLKRRVAFEEQWEVADGARALTVTLTVKTPRGVKRRTQVYVRGGGQPPAVSAATI